jgi:tetratricopeptide (TPR) repeat protein
LPDRAEVWVEKAACLARCGPERSAEAIQCFQRAIEIDNKSTGGYGGLIYLLYGLGRVEEAESWVVKAFEVTRPWSMRVWILHDKNDIRKLWMNSNEHWGFSGTQV